MKTTVILQGSYNHRTVERFCGRKDREGEKITGGKIVRKEQHRREEEKKEKKKREK